MKKFLYLILCTFYIYAFLTGCGPVKQQTENQQTSAVEKSLKTSNVTGQSQEKTPLIACIVNQDDDYMKMLQLGMSDKAEELGAKVILANTYGNLDKEIELINMYIKSGVDGICIHPVSVDFSTPILMKAKEKGIKVVSAGIKIPDTYDIPYIQSDDQGLGQKTGEACRNFIEKQLGGNANIAILNYRSQFPEESDKRTEGFKSEIAKLPGAKIVAEREAWLSETAITEATSIINSHPDLNIIWAANEGGTVGADMAVKNAGKAGRIFVFGTDVSENILSMLVSSDNILQAVTGQQPYEIGKQSMEQIINDIKGEQAKSVKIISGVPLSRTNKSEIDKYIEYFKTLIGAK